MTKRIYSETKKKYVYIYSHVLNVRLVFTDYSLHMSLLEIQEYPSVLIAVAYTFSSEEEK